MTKLTDLRGSECLPKKKENSMRYSGHTVNAFNEVVSQLEQVELCVDEKLMKVECDKNPNYDDELPDEIFNKIREAVLINDKEFLTNMMKFSVNKTREECVKSLSQSKEKWLKLEVRK